MAKFAILLGMKSGNEMRFTCDNFEAKKNGSVINSLTYTASKPAVMFIDVTQIEFIQCLSQG